MAISYLQSGGSSNGLSASARTGQYASNATAASMLLISVTCYTAGITLTVSDDINGAWGQVGSYSSNSQSVTSLWCFPNTAGGGKPTITVTPSGAAYLTLMFAEWSGVATSNPVHDVQTATIASTSTPTSATVAAAAGELIVAVFGQESVADTSWTANSPFTVRQHFNGSAGEGGLLVSDESASGNEAASTTISSPVVGASLIASFKLATAPATGGQVIGGGCTVMIGA